MSLGNETKILKPPSPSPNSTTCPYEIRIDHFFLTKGKIQIGTRESDIKAL